MNRDGTVSGGERDAAPRRNIARVDAATIVIVIVWLAIWLLWPMNGTDRPRLRVPTNTRVGFLAGGQAAPWYVEPDWFARTTRPGFGMPDVTAAMDSAVPERAVMDAPRFVDGGMKVERPGSGSMPEADANAEHRVRWSSSPAFQPPAAPPAVVVVMSAELNDCRYALPPCTNDVVKMPSKPWQVVAHVDVGADGRTENVLIELGCEDSQVNATIVRWLQRGVAGQAGVPASGRVTVSGSGSPR